MRVIIFGTGKIYARYREKLSEMNIVAFLDNDEGKQGTYLDGRPIDSPENIAKYDYDYIFIASVHHKEMRKQLEVQGVDSELIIDAEHRGYWERIRKIEKYDFIENSVADRKILLITHDFSLTGAPLMLYYAAEILKKNGYGVTVYSRSDGPLKHDYLSNRISISIFSNYDFSDYEMKHYFSGYHMILANTVVLFGLVEKIEKVEIPVMWWIHEEDNVYEEYQIRELPRYNRLSVYCVSKRAVNSYEKYSGNRDVKQLVYGIPNEIYSKQENCKGYGKKMIYAIIGYVSKRKGHDIFIASVEKNWDRWKDNAEFWVIGIITESQRKEMEATGKVRVFGSMDHSDLIKIYSEIDVVVCPSRNDPMPVVLAEAMMNKKICIASDMTGTAEKIVPYENGLICRAGDVDSLSEQIDWSLEHNEQLESMGERAYEVYRQNFSQEQFKKNLFQIVDSIMDVKED